MEETKKGEIIIYKAQGDPEIKVKLDGETVWLTQAQIARLFQTDRTSIGRHIKNILNSAELRKNSVCAIFAHTAQDGKIYKVKYYNLDLIISVGYRVNSSRATQFRIWATQKLRELIVQGYSIYEKRFFETQVKLKELESANRLFRELIESRKSEGYEKELLNIIIDYTNTWFVLNQYDKGSLKIEDVSRKKSTVLDYEEVKKTIAKFKTRLMQQKQASDLFGKEVEEKLKAVLFSINQTFSGEELYLSIEEKAAHLLYFAIKDHPFVDGNKRIGSLLFLLYLVENHYFLNKKGERKINDSALAALALLIAESKPQQKDVMVKLVVNLINKK